MLENLSRDRPWEAALSANTQLIPDPWDLPNVPSEQVQMPEN